MTHRAAIPLATLLAGCAVGMPAVPMQSFVEGNLPAVADFARHEATAGAVENQALLFNILGECELMTGDLDEAWRHFGAAGRVMGSWETSGR